MDTSQLRELLGPVERLDMSHGVGIRSEHYVALGCDLMDLPRFETLLASEIDTSSSLILCTAEVSVTYMNLDGADALIRWAAHYDNSTLALCALSYRSLALMLCISILLSPRTILAGWR